MTCRPDLWAGNVARKTYEPFWMGGSETVTNGDGSRSGQRSARVGAYPSLVTYARKEPLCGMATRYWKVNETPGVRLVVGQSARTRSSPRKADRPPLHSF